MTLPSFNAEQSLYRSSRHYRSSALASAVGGIRPSDDLPDGSYQNSCYDCGYDGSTLRCYCYNECGNSVNTIMTYVTDCVGCDILNDNGVLRCCASQGIVAPYDNPSGCATFPPWGSYHDSCENCCYNTDFDTLSCYCYDECGRPIYTEKGNVSWDCPKCDIYNSNGQLGCC